MLGRCAGGAASVHSALREPLRFAAGHTPAAPSRAVSFPKTIVGNAAEPSAIAGSSTGDLRERQTSSVTVIRARTSVSSRTRRTSPRGFTTASVSPCRRTCFTSRNNIETPPCESIYDKPVMSNVSGEPLLAILVRVASTSWMLAMSISPMSATRA